MKKKLDVRRNNKEEYGKMLKVESLRKVYSWTIYINYPSFFFFFLFIYFLFLFFDFFKSYDYIWLEEKLRKRK